MRSYSETIDYFANRMFGQYMNGSNDVRTYGTSEIAYIYGVPEAQVVQQLDRQYEKVKKEYYDRRKV